MGAGRRVAAARGLGAPADRRAFSVAAAGCDAGADGALLGVGYLFLQHSLEMHQQLVQRQRLEAVVCALERELAALLRQVQDYTVWNDAHTAISRRDAP